MTGMVSGDYYIRKWEGRSIFGLASDKAPSGKKSTVLWSRLMPIPQAKSSAERLETKKSRLILRNSGKGDRR
ncbi:MAG: hypothetical protein JRD68_07760 [Deltaproteobacteria bacterium]|nr:hypothetical protein [Deltaproteobacteria bacterium]